MSALHDVVKAGKARYIGASAMFAWQFAKAQYTAQIGGWTRFVSMQNRYNLANRGDEREMIPCCLDQRIGVVPYSPLARGLLAGTRERAGQQRTARARAGDSSYRPADFDVADAVAAVASQRHLPFRGIGPDPAVRVSADISCDQEGSELAMFRRPRAREVGYGRYGLDERRPGGLGKGSG